MIDILFLVHRLPYPPNKGDKIRSYNMFKFLTARYNVHLGCFVDDREDMRYIKDLEVDCKSISAVSLSGSQSRLRSIAGLLSGEALTLPYYRNAELESWVEKTIEQNKIRGIVAFSSPMAQYVLHPRFSNYRRVMDFVDIDSDKWRQYARKRKQPFKWVYNREARKLAEFERRVTDVFDAVVFVSENETATFSKMCPEHAGKAHTIRNGVDLSFFDPHIGFESPFDPAVQPIVFTGMMDYWPNIDAVQWFADEIFPEVQSQLRAAEFWIVGASPAKDVVRLGDRPGIRVTGRVDDVRPYISNASTIVAPLRIARGVQNKILEALAMGQAVVCTPQAAAGLADLESCPSRVADTAEEFSKGVLESIASKLEPDQSMAARGYVLKQYDWDQNLKTLEFLAEATPGPADAIVAGAVSAEGSAR